MKETEGLWDLLYAEESDEGERWGRTDDVYSDDGGYDQTPKED